MSLAFVLINIRQPIWSGYLAVLDQSNPFRQYVLMKDASARPTHQSHTFDSTRYAADQQFQMWFSAGFNFASSNQVQEAKKIYQQIISMAESTPQSSPNGQAGTRQKALALNNLAWLLTTCEDIHLREPDVAVSYAKQAVELADSEGNYWNTLGVAYFRIGDWDRATEAIGRSMELSKDGEGDSHDWFFLAMIQAHKNQKEKAREWYDRAVEWFHNYRQADRELYRFQIEAAQALGIPKPLPPSLPMPPKPPGFAHPVYPGKSQRISSLAPFRKPYEFVMIRYG